MMDELESYSAHIFEMGCMDQRVYLKSEADKVIAHHKHKRCMAMANYWGLVSACTHREIQLKCMRRELKWHKLAEQFKGAK